ncbi:tetratricopeptide repeat protein [Candidatus Dependentiae bacterium]|nr:tetratricopeptide repeat protein [Candidatus Dependentiae bacterium]
MKRFIAVVLLLVISNTILYAVENPSDVFQEANSYYFKKDYINAIKYFRKVINDFPANSYTDHSLFGLGSSFFELDNFKDAIAVYSQLIEEFPNSSFADDALFRIGESYERIGEYKNAHIFYSKLINQYPNSLLLAQSREKINKFSSLLLKPESSDQQTVKTQPASEKLLTFPQQINISGETGRQLEQTEKGQANTVKPQVDISKIKKIPATQQPAVNLVPVKIPESVSQPVQSHKNAAGEQMKQIEMQADKKILEKQYVIRPDDTLTSIAEKFYGDFNLYTRIADYNNIKNPTNIKIGETILIPFETDEKKQETPSIPDNSDQNQQTESAYRDVLNELDAEDQKSAGIKPIEKNKTDDAYIYSYKLEKERKNYEQLLNIEKDKRRQLLEKIRNLETQIARMNLEIDTYKNNLNSLQELKTKLTDFEKTNSDLIESLKLQKQKEIIREAKNKTELLKLQRDLEDLTSKYNVAKADFESKKYNEMITQKEQQLAQTSILISQLNNKIQSMESDNSNFRNQIDKLQRELIVANEYRTKVAGYEQQLTDKNKIVSDLDESLKKLTLSNKTLSDSVIEIQTKYETVYNSKNKLESVNKEISDKLTKKEAELLEFAKQIQSFNKEIENLKADYQTKLDTAAAEKKNTQKIIEDLTTNNKYISEELMKLKNRIIELQKDSISSKEGKTKSDQKSALMESQIQTLNSTIDNLTKESNSLKTELNTLKDLHSTTETNWKNKELAYQSEIAAVKQQNTSLATNLKSKESELQTIQELSKKTDSETVNKLKELNDKLNSQLLMLQNEINSLQKQYISSSDDKEKPAGNQVKKETPVKDKQSQSVKSKDAKTDVKTQIKEISSSKQEESSNTPKPDESETVKNTVSPSTESDIISKMEIDRNKKSAKEQIAKGIIFKNKGDFQNAESCYKKALELDPENADGYNHLGFLYTEFDKNLDIAADLVNKAVQLNSGDKGYYYDTLGWIYYKQGLYQKSKKYISDALELIPQNDKQALASVYYHLGMVYMKLNDPNNAFFQFIEVLKLSPNSTAAIKSKQQLDLL